MKKVCRIRKNLLLGLLSLSTIVPLNLANAEELEEFTLDPIVVTATRTVSRNMDIPASMTVISPEEIQNKGAVTLADALEGLPGVSVVRYNGRSGAAYVFLNGTDQVVMLIDGVRINSVQGVASGTGGVNLNEYGINAETIERIEVMRGGGSSLYGADAVGGVIQIFTKAGSEKTFNYFGAAFGNQDQQLYKVGTSGKYKKYSWRLSGNFYETDGYRLNGNSRDKDLSIRLDRDTNGGKLFFTYDHNSKKAGYPGSLAFPSLTDNGLVINNRFSLAYQKDNLNLQVYRLSRNNGVNDWGGHSSHKEEQNGFFYQDSADLGKNHFLTWGVDLKEAKIDSSSYVTNKKRRTQAYFLQDTIKIGNKFSLLPGLRYEDNSDFGDRWLPKIGAVYKADSKLSLFANWGKVFRAPSFDDLYWNDPWMPGNPNLRPERGWLAELGVKKMFNNKHEASLTFFKRQMKDKIAWRPIGFLWTPMNVESYKTLGMVLAWNGKINEKLKMDANYTYLNSDSSTAFNEPRHQFNLGVHYSNKKFTQSINLTSSYKMDQQIGSEVNGRAVLNTSTQFKIAKEQRIYLNIYNVFDKDYFERKNYPANGRSFLLGWDIKFK